MGISIPKATIYKSVKYDRINFRDDNREISTPHVRELVKSMEKYGFLVSNPILVDKEQMTILDGQHRFLAAKKLGIPYYYTYATGEDDTKAEFIRDVNITHKNWSTSDYRKQLVNSGDANYSNYQKMLERYDCVTPKKGIRSEITLGFIDIIIGGGFSAISPAKKKAGGLNLTDELYNKYCDELDTVNNILIAWQDAKKEKCYKPTKAVFVAVLYCVRNGADISRMMQVAQDNADDIRATSSVNEALRQWSEFYDFNLRKQNKKQFYAMYIGGPRN